MTVPPPIDEEEAPEFSDDTTFDEEFWRDYAVGVVGYRKEWVDELVAAEGITALVRKLGSRPGSA